MEGPFSPALVRKAKGKNTIDTDSGMETPKISGQAKRAAARSAAKSARADMIAIWDQIVSEYSFTLCRNPHKDKTKKGMYVLSATAVCSSAKRKRRKRGKSKRSKVIQSDKFGIRFSSFQEAQTTAARLKFGSALHKHLQCQRKRYRPNVQAACSKDLRQSPSRQWYKSDIEEKRVRISRLAQFHNVQQEVKDATKGYTDFRCVKDWKRLDNFLRSLCRMRDARIKREKRDAKHRELAAHLRKGLSAGAMYNFVRAMPTDDDEATAWRRRGEDCHPLRSDYSAYDLEL